MSTSTEHGGGDENAVENIGTFPHHSPSWTVTDLCDTFHGLAVEKEKNNLKIKKDVPNALLS